MKHSLRILCAFILTLALFVTSALAVTDNNQRLDAGYTVALSYISAGDYDKALTYLNACLNYCDENTNPAICADVHLKLGCVYTIQKDYEKAEAELDAALAIEPDLYSVYMVKAQIYTEQEMYEEAIEVLRLYIEASGDDTMNVTLAELYTLAGDDATGEEILNNYSQSLEAAKANYEAATAKMEEGLYEEAAELYLLCLEDSTYGPGACYLAGACLINCGNFVDAQLYLESALVAGVTVDGIYYNCGLCRMMQEDYANAIVYFTASINVESYVEDAAYNRAVCYLNTAQYEEAVTNFTYYIEQNAPVEGEEMDEDYTKAVFFRAMSYMLSEHYAEAAADFTECIALDYVPTTCRVNRALCYVQTGEFEAAVEDSTACIELGEAVAECSYYRGVAYANLGKLEESVADFTVCIEMEYDLANIYYQRAQIYAALGDEAAYLSDLENSLNF